MCLTYQTNDKHFLVNYGSDYIGLKSFRVLNRQLVGLWRYDNYQVKKVFDNDKKIKKIEVEPNNQVQDIELAFYSLNSFGVMSKYTKETRQANLGYHAIFFTDFLANHLLNHYDDNLSLIFDMIPIVFNHADIQAISDSIIVVEKFSIRLDIKFYSGLAKKLNKDDSVTISHWLETLSFFKESLGLGV